MMRCLFISTILLLTGCASNSEVEPVVITKVVSAPERYIKCDAVTPERPTFPLDVVDVSRPLLVLVGEALAEIELRNAYEARLLASLSICKGEGR